MKKLLGCLLIVMLAALFSAQQATAGVSAITFDENGNYDSFFTGSGMSPDPTGGINGNVLIFTLPAPVLGGDIRIWEEGSNNTVLSDVLRFYFIDPNGQANFSTTSDLADHMIFYSDNADGAEALADTGLPGNLLTVFQDGGGAPEYINPATGNTEFLYAGFYHGISDYGTPIPEPSTFLLLGAGLAGLGIIRRRFRK
jgi:hypothetical protein